MWMNSELIKVVAFHPVLVSPSDQNQSIFISLQQSLLSFCFFIACCCPFRLCLLFLLLFRSTVSSRSKCRLLFSSIISTTRHYFYRSSPYQREDKNFLTSARDDCTYILVGPNSEHKYSSCRVTVVSLM